MRVLIVEDEPFMARALVNGLRREAIAADHAPDGHSALEQVACHDYDVVVLDRDLPGVHGDDVCRRITERYSSMRVLMLTAAASLDDRVDGLRLGADDYLPKPFDFPELVARLHALHRRSGSPPPPVLEWAGVRLDPFRREAYREDRYLRLTRKEFAVLHVLMTAQGGVVSAETLLEKAWDQHTDPFTQAVRVTVSTLRRKLGEPALLHTRTGAGYYLGPRP
ncbi:response regulator transcription factor [Streptomyces sp. NPDC088729]|uniref:response regulator transcription factor n=1 Tax=Streptomyces sp. NPDC088729 TaxID=3365876 RepID=UPI003811614E